MKKRITSSQKKFLESELAYLKNKNAINEVVHLEDYYDIEEKQSRNSVHTLLWVGSLLVGVGFSSFIASNWSALSSITKYFMIFFGIMFFYFAGWKTEKTLPKTAKSLFYIGGFLFGSGIFLIGQTFHLGGDVHTAFLFWAIGIIPLAYYLKDKVVLSFSIILLFLYSMEIYVQGNYPLILLAAIPLIYLINHYIMDRSKVIFLMNTALLIHFLHAQLWYFGVNQFILITMMFLLGILISLLPLKEYVESMKISAYILHGAYGIALTMPGIWDSLFPTNMSQSFAIVFAVLYGLYIILLVRKGKLLAILILCSLLFRFYVDISYDFLPKSLFFIVGGFILILFGFWFERSRRGDNQNHENKKF